MTKDWLSEDDARAMLTRKVHEAGTAEALAKQFNCSPSLISAALLGDKPVGPTIAAGLGLIATSVKTYRYLVRDVK